VARKPTSKGFRIDVTYSRPNGYQEYGLVDYPSGAEPTTPTLFVGAYCKTKADERWLKDAVDAIVSQSRPGSRA
jgi:hypothetical protein